MQSPLQLIKFYLSQNLPTNAILTYTQLRREGIHHYHIIPLFLKACASLSLINHGKSLHAESIKSGVVSNVMIGTSLVSFYSKCDDLVDSRKLFDGMPERNVVSWNAMMEGYCRIGDMGSALMLFGGMPMMGTSVTWGQMIDGFARSGDIVSARRLFDEVPWEMKNVVVWTVMVDGYVRNGDMEAARRVFEEMPERNFFVWSSMIAGYCKKGDVKDAKGIFDRILVRNVVNWNALIAGYAQNGFCEEALETFRRMQIEGFEPDGVSVTSVLSACAQLGSLDSGKEIHDLIKSKGIKLNQFVSSGLVDIGFLKQGLEIFSKMTEKYGLIVGIKHYGCMVDLLGRAGMLEEAYNLITRMSMKPNDVIWGTLLGACKVHLNTEMAERVMKEIDAFHSHKCMVDDAQFVLLSNIYAASDRWEKAEKMREMMVKNGVQKIRGCSSISLGCTKFSFMPLLT
ncbi:hypothetical protein GIB67_029815 [Kingdonia uniflora]|uniref:Chlororespiratory reduction 4 n=1 Tax=Kingdonia uniflora TaxID=39325 RepID=A0A7J7NJ25_9MAGN|nr:hypothetical protein GIB67_029815 [Kingdonia uniflora]